MGKRIISIILSAVCLFVPAQTAFADDADTLADTASVYADVSAEEAVAALTDMGVIQGDGSGDFNGDAPLTKAMMWVFLARLSGEDIAKGETWYEGAAQWCSNACICNSNYPDELITADAAIRMLYSYAGYYGSVAYRATLFSTGYISAAKWAEYVGLDIYDGSTELTRNDAAVLLYKFHQYLQCLTYEEFASMLCDAYGIEPVFSRGSSVHTAITSGLISVEDIIRSGEKLSDLLYLTVPTDIVLETISRLSGAAVEEIAKAVPSTETISDEYAQVLVDEFCSDEESYPNLNSFLQIDDDCGIYENYFIYFGRISKLFNGLDNVPSYILLQFIEDGWRLVLTDEPTEYTTTDVSIASNENAAVAGITDPTTKTIAILSSTPVYEHEFGHYAIWRLTDGYTPSNEYTQAIASAFRKEGSTFAAATDGHYGENYKEFSAEVFSRIVSGDDDKEDLSQTAPEMYALVQYALDEATWTQGGL